MICFVEGCGIKARSKRMCNVHYRRFMKRGDLLSFRERYDRTIRKRFILKVFKTQDCWEWMGSFNDDGYGKFFIQGKKFYAHRIIWEFQKGLIPKEMEVCHSCDNERCVNPEHLFLGTQKDNVADMDRKGRRNTSPRFWGESCHLSKLKEHEVIKIRDMHQDGLKGIEIAKTFNITGSAVSHIINRQTWKHI